MRTLSRMTVAGAAAVALLLAPVGVAAAQAVTAAPADHSSNPSITLTPEQRTAVLTARSAYIKTAAGIRTTYRQTVTSVLKTSQESTASAELAYQTAKDAYVFTRVTGGTDAEVASAKSAFETAQSALRSALDAAKATAQPALDAARSKARSDLDTAKADYVKAVATAVPSAPAWLLVPPGGGKSWISHGFGKDGMSMGMGSRS